MFWSYKFLNKVQKNSYYDNNGNKGNYITKPVKNKSHVVYSESLEGYLQYSVDFIPKIVSIVTPF